MFAIALVLALISCSTQDQSDPEADPFASSTVPTPTTENAALTNLDDLPKLANCMDTENWQAYEIETEEIYLNAVPPCTANGLGDRVEIASWDQWSTTFAWAKARLGTNTCEPDCSTGNYKYQDVRITLDSPRQGFFGRLTIDYSDGNQWVIDVAPRSALEALLIRGPDFTCDEKGWSKVDGFPITYCEEGPSIKLIQERLGVKLTGRFGLPLWNSLLKFKIQRGLPADSYDWIDEDTWRALFEGFSIDGLDSDGDGLLELTEIERP